MVRNTIIENLVTALKGIKKSAGYNLNIIDVTRYPIGLSTSRLSTPIIQVVMGEDIRQVESDTYVRYVMTPSLFFMIKSGNEMSLEVERAIADAKKIINEGIDLGDNVLSVKIEAFAPYIIEETGYAAVDVRLRIVYYESKGNTATTLTDVYGSSDWLYNAHQYLYTKLSDMITDMSALSPKISYAYERHNIAELQLNGVSVALELADDELGGLQDGVYVRHNAVFSIRVHTGYQGDELDDKETMMLLNSVSAYLHQYHKLADNYRIRQFMEYSARNEFTDSASIGGQFLVRIEIPELHTQG